MLYEIISVHPELQNSEICSIACVFYAYFDIFLFFYFFFNVGIQAQELRGVEWRRVSSLCPRPRLVVDGVSRKDVVQVMGQT